MTFNKINTASHSWTHVQKLNQSYLFNHTHCIDAQGCWVSRNQKEDGKDCEEVSGLDSCKLLNSFRVFPTFVLWFPIYLKGGIWSIWVIPNLMSLWSACGMLLNNNNNFDSGKLTRLLIYASILGRDMERMWHNCPKKKAQFLMVLCFVSDEVLTSLTHNPNLTEPVRLISPSGSKQDTLRIHIQELWQ